MSTISNIQTDLTKLKLDILKKEFDRTMKIYDGVKNDYISDLSKLPSEPTENITVNNKVDYLKHRLDQIQRHILRLQKMYPYEKDIIKIQKMDKDFNDLVAEYTQTNNDYVNAVTNYSQDSNQGFVDNIDVAEKQKIMDELNKKLITMTGTYLDELTSTNPDNQQEIKQKEEDKMKLHTVYDNLLAERAKIEEMLIDYSNLDTEYDQNLIKTIQNDSHFNIYIAVTILIVFYLIKVILLPNTNSNLFSGIFWISFFFMFLFTSFRLNEAPGFVLWGSFIVFFALAKMNIVPSP